MPEPTLFDALRRVGNETNILYGSKVWMEDPITTAGRHLEKTIAISTNGNPSVFDESLRQSTFGGILISGRWAACGYPTITLGHRAAKRLMETRIDPLVADENVRAQWPAFAIRVPPGLLWIEWDGRPREVSLVMATCIDSEKVDSASESLVYLRDRSDFGKHRWWYRIFADAVELQPPWLSDNVYGFFKGITLWSFNISTELLAAVDGGSSVPGFQRWETQPKLASDELTEQRARSLILGLSDVHRTFEIKQRKSMLRPSDLLPCYTEIEVSFPEHLILVKG